ncbi:transposable element Tcb2 transposase [Trichonephila clavipes]|nr:transposable element Tcb2 transposase [Trichonephila clavipes]
MGRTSLNGVVTAISLDTLKAVDAKILSRKCSCNFNSNVHSDEYSAGYIVNSRGVEVAEIVVGRLEGGQSQDEVAQAIGVSQSVISKIWDRFLETRRADRRPGQGRRRATTHNEDRYLVLTALRERNMNTILLQRYLRSATGTTVSTQTVRNLLHGEGLYARRHMVCVRLTSRHRRDGREWATEHVNWRRNEWSNVLFSDVPFFCSSR